MIDIEDDMLSGLQSADYEGFIKLGIEFSDAVIKAGDTEVKGLNPPSEKLKDSIEEDEDFNESYYNLYNELVG